jgi:hypothetical protein
VEKSPSPTPFEAPCEIPTVAVAMNIEFCTVWTAKTTPEVFSFAIVCLRDFCSVKNHIHLSDTTCYKIDIAFRQVMHPVGCHYIL